MISRFKRRIRRLVAHLRPSPYPIKRQVTRALLSLGGTNGYGQWTVCPDALDEHSVVYSFGVGEDITFDLAIVEQFNLHLFAFDPTPRSITFIERQRLPPGMRFYPWGIADRDGTARFNPPEDPEHVSHTLLDRPSTREHAIEVPVKRLAGIMAELGHDHIDVLKMDIEGAEYAVIEDIVASRLSIGQILVEFHHRFSGVGPRATRRAIERLNQAGYKIFNVGANRVEFSFIKT